MGTSTRWEGPKGGRWAAAGGRLARWPRASRDADQQLDEIAADYLRALQETLRADPSAFGLYETACAAGERLAGALGSLAQEGARSENALIARLVSEVGGDGGTLADAAVRRGLVAAARDVRGSHPELDDVMGAGGGFAWDILCDLYQVFFADLVGEFLRSVVAEHVQLAVPVLVVADPEGRIAGWVAEKVVDLVPNPCEESAEATELAQAVGTAESVMGMAQDPAAVLPKVAEKLVPGAVGKVLGLITEEAVSGEGAAA
ncbi:hypothetical protein GTY65_09540 [Streptomyces sp. SID8379]|uniref:hypothetical protein n=1 Tax=unclassified Streptomyces TaxID=2593676 RepID=UPI001319D351|nr:MULTISPECIES: hypothetical protein [unclassified Streptomyces]MYW64314.1 hypothetical protein [Streptomyces sp. SID8379]